MTVHEVAPLIQGALATGVLALVLTRGAVSHAYVRWFALFILGQILWGLAVFGLRGSSDLDWALRWERFAPAAVSLAGFSFYYFTRVTVKASPPRWLNILAAGHFLISLASIPTPYLVKGVEKASYGNTAVWGDGFIPWALPVYLAMALSIGTLYKGFRQASSYTERNRLLLLLIAASFAVVGSLLDVAPVLGLDVPPATAWTNSLFFILTGVSIFRYQLLDIQVAVQHRFSYAVRSTANVLLLAAVVPLLWWAGLPVWSLPFLALALVLAAEPGWRRLDGFLRTRLEKDLHAELQTLFMDWEGPPNTLQVGTRVLELVHRVCRPAHSLVLLVQDGYARPLAAMGYPSNPQGPLHASHPLVRWLSEHPEPAFHDDLIIEPPFQSMPSSAAKDLAALEGTIYVPLGTGQSLEAVLVAGPKGGQGIYSWQEIEFLGSLGQQGGLLLESIRLHEAERAQRERIEHLREIQRLMVQARDEERRGLAAEIHDDPIQMLVGSLVRLNLVRNELVNRPDLSRQQLDHVTANLRRAEKSLRHIMTGAFPTLLQDLGLTPALEALCADLQASGAVRTPLRLSMEVSGIPSPWSPPLTVSLVIYRFTQEGLRNVLAHSAASEAWVTVRYGFGGADLEVLDNGRSIDEQEMMSRRQEGHLGLLGLEERLGALGGSISLEEAAHGGARLKGQFPHTSPSPDPEARWCFRYEFTPPPLAEEGAK